MPPTNNKILAIVTNIPPIDAIFDMFLSPLVDIYVIVIISIIPKIPKSFEPLNPNNSHSCVLSLQNKKLEAGTHIDDATLTIHIILDVYHIKVPRKANLLPTDFSIQE